MEFIIYYYKNLVYCQNKHHIKVLIHDRNLFLKCFVGILEYFWASAMQRLHCVVVFKAWSRWAPLVTSRNCRGLQAEASALSEHRTTPATFWFIAMLSFILISNKQRIYQSLICTKIPEQDTMSIQEPNTQNEAKHSGVFWKIQNNGLFALQVLSLKCLLYFGPYRSQPKH